MNIMIIQTEDENILQLCLWNVETANGPAEFCIPLSFDDLKSLEDYFSDFTSGRMQRLIAVMDNLKP